MNKVILLLDDSEESSSKSYLSKLISMGIYNFTRNSEGIKYLLTNPNSYRDVAHLHVINENIDNIISDQPSNSKRIIGVKSLTDGAGASTLIYMMKKQLLHQTELQLQEMVIVLVEDYLTIKLFL